MAKAKAEVMSQAESEAQLAKELKALRAEGKAGGEVSRAEVREWVRKRNGKRPHPA